MGLHAEEVREVSPQEADRLMDEMASMPTATSVATQQSLDVKDDTERAIDEAKEKNFQDVPCRETFTIRLTTEEKADKAILLADLAGDINEIDAEKKKANSDLKARKDGKLAAQQAIIRQLNEGIDRELECVKRLNWSTDKVQYLDKDTLKVLKERTMKPEDRQLQLTQNLGPNPFVSETDSFDAGQVRALREEGTELEDTKEIAHLARSNNPIDL